jgi:AMIN domain
MLKKSRTAIRFLAALGFCTFLSVPSFPQSKATVQRVAILGNERGIQVQITATQPIPTQSQLLTGPDRLVIDFPGAAPGSQLRGLTVNQGGIKGVRVGLFSAEPPTTRVVVDLSSASPYQIVPNGNSVILKVGTDEVDIPGVKPPSAQPVSDQALVAAVPAPPAPNLLVNFQRGELTVHAQKATLAEVLFAIQQRTGADIPIPAGAEQEQVVADAGPGPAKDVLTALLTGTRFNFIVVGSDQNDGSLRSVILSPKSDLGTAIPAGMQPVTPINQEQDVPDAPPEQVQLPPPTTPPPPPLQPNEVPGQQSNEGVFNPNQVPTEIPQSTGPGQPPVQPVPDENSPPPDEQ